MVLEDALLRNVVAVRVAIVVDDLVIVDVLAFRRSRGHRRQLVQRCGRARGGHRAKGWMGGKGVVF
jgi:hypothetical protein